MSKQGGGVRWRVCKNKKCEDSKDQLKLLGPHSIAEGRAQGLHVPCAQMAEATDGR